jgi:hypothetical protein
MSTTFVEENTKTQTTPKTAKGSKSAMTQKSNQLNRTQLTSLITNLSAVTNKDEYLRLEDNTAVCALSESSGNIGKIKEELVGEANKAVDTLKAVISNISDENLRTIIRHNTKRKDFVAMQKELDELEVEALVMRTVIKRHRLIESVKCADIVSTYINKLTPKYEIASLDMDESILMKDSNSSH